MSLRLGALHDALSNPGDQELARKAAEEVAAYENRLASLDSHVAVVTWMAGFNLLLTLAIFWRVFTT
jgi:hypothetical protein